MATDLSPYYSPINSALFSTLALALLAIGVLLSGTFFVYEVTTPKAARNFAREVVSAALASVFLGFGGLFLLLWVGIYV